MRKSSRRTFLTRSLLGLGSAILAACAPTQTGQVTPTLTAPAQNKTPTPPDQSPLLPTEGAARGSKNTPARPGAGAGGPGIPAKTAPGAILLGRPTDDAITASLLLPSDHQIILEYGLKPGDYTQQTAPVALKANIPQQIEIAQLKPNTEYSYRILTDGAPSGEHTFRTQRAPGSTFTFTIDADPHNRDPNFSGELYAAALANALVDRPDFHINLGDTFMTEKIKPQTSADAESTFLDMRPYFGILGADAPLFLVNGNHEGELGWLLRGKDGNLPIWSTRLRQKYYPNPTPNHFYTGSATPEAALGAVRDGYYAWTWGDALFMVLDPFWYTVQKPQVDNLSTNWNWTLGREQYGWLKATLETSPAKFKLVFIHHLVGGDSNARGGIEFVGLFEWGGKNPDGSPSFAAHRPGWAAPIHQLLVDHHVSAVFHGHDHLFARQNLDGIVYQEVPQPSITETNGPRLAAEYGYTHGDVLGSSGHLRATVSPAQVTIAYVRARLPGKETVSGNGQVEFTYTIPAPS